jgi:hypothetical protein
MPNGNGNANGNGNGGAAAPVDLPDPSSTAKGISLFFLLAALGAAILYDVTGWAQNAFNPTGPGTPPGGNFGLFAGFFIGTTIIERLLELIAPQVPFWPVPTPPAVPPAGGGAPVPVDPVPYKKADRGYVMLSVAALLGALLSGALGLYFLSLVGMQVKQWVDIFFSGLVIAGGTKALHELIKSLEAVKTGGGGTTAG